MEVIDRIMVPFLAHGTPGEVEIAYRTNDDPVALGFGRRGLDFPPDVAQGFPVFEAAVSYDGAGYDALMGWIQVVQLTLPDRSIETILDGLPAAREAGIPFCSWGLRPAFFDAPAITRRPVDWWRADTFLTIMPSGPLVPAVTPVCAVKWGFSVSDDGKVTCAPVEKQPLACWQNHVDTLSSVCPRWRFLDQEH